VHQLDVVAPAGWMDPALDHLQLLFMHQDQVTALPDGGRLLARTDHCPIAMFDVGSMVGLQAHPEFSTAFVAALVNDRVERIGPERSQAALHSLATPLDADAVARWLGRVLAPDS
jgi:GMP synthase-like glutamine amidotransferase